MTALGLYNPITKHAICEPGHIAYAAQAPAFPTWGEYGWYIRKNNSAFHGEIEFPRGRGRTCHCCLLSPSDDSVIFGNGHDVLIGGNHPDGLGIIEKVNRAGEIVWAIDASDVDDDGGIYRMEYLPSGNIVTCGSLKSGSNPYNVLIVDPSDGSIVQRITAPVPDNGYQLLSVAVDKRDSSFVVASRSENTTDENVFKYILSGGEYVLDWQVHTAENDWPFLMLIAANGDVIIGMEFLKDNYDDDEGLNNHIWVFDEDGNEVKKWRPRNATWEWIPGPDYWEWQNLTDEEVYGGFLDADGNLYYVTPTIMYKYSSSYVFIEEISYGSYDSPRDFAPTSTKGIWFCKQHTINTAHFMVFNTGSKTFTELFAQAAIGIATHPSSAHQARKDRLPRISTKGSGHFFPMFKKDCFAFIDNTVKSYLSEDGTFPDYPELNYAKDDILVTGLHKSNTDDQFGEIKKARQDGNCELDGYYPVDNRFFKRISHAGPKPFRTINTSMFVGYLCYHNGSYYKAKTDAADQFPPPNATHWDAVAAPDPDFDSYADYGGKGHLATPPSLSPQVYTFAIAEILDTGDASHLINGIHHLKKKCAGKDIQWSSGIYRKNYMGFEGTAQQLIITFHLYQKMATPGDPTYDRKTILKVELANRTTPKWQNGDSYDTGEWTKKWDTIEWLYYSSKENNNMEEPPHADWNSEGSTPPANDSLFEKTFDDTVNYGCVMSGDEAANENDDHTTVGHDGTVSFYPGKIKAWAARIVYASGEKCVFGGRFHSSNSDNNKNNQPDVTGWTVIT